MMRVEVEHGVTTIICSRRNLLTLLAKLDGNPPDSECTIGAPPAYGWFAVKAEEDDEHYNHPNRAEVVGDTTPGSMHPATEAAMAGKIPDGFELVAPLVCSIPEADHGDTCNGWPRLDCAVHPSSVFAERPGQKIVHAHSFPLGTGVCACGAEHPILGPAKWHGA